MKCAHIVCPYCGDDTLDPDTKLCCGEPHGVQCGMDGNYCGDHDDGIVSSTSWRRLRSRGLPYELPEDWTKEDVRESNMESWGDEP